MRKHIPPTIHPSWHSWRVFEDDHFPNFPVWWVPCDRFPWRVPARSTLREFFFIPKKVSPGKRSAWGVTIVVLFATKKWSKVVLRLDKPWPTRWYGKIFYGKTIEQLGPVSIARFQLRLPEKNGSILFFEFPPHSSQFSLRKYHPWNQQQVSPENESGLYSPKKGSLSDPFPFASIIFRDQPCCKSCWDAKFGVHHKNHVTWQKSGP